MEWGTGIAAQALKRTQETLRSAEFRREEIKFLIERGHCESPDDLLQPLWIC